MNLNDILKKQKDFFTSEKTLDYHFRKEALKKLRQAIIQNEEKIMEALKVDLNKSTTEGYLTEISMVYEEISHTLKHLKRWMAPKKVSTSIAHFPSKSWVGSEPFGSVLVLAPWNYPFQLCFAPIAAAIAAGNCIILKPSRSTPTVYTIIKTIVRSVFDEEFFAVIDETTPNDEILAHKYDFIFFTGSEDIGREILKVAASNLTPVVLELGGKSPLIIEESADIKLTAKRVAWGKWLNAGQTCIAPDYLLIQKSVKEPFIKELKKAITELYTQNPLKNENFIKIISKKHFDRLLGLTEGEKILIGGGSDPERLIIEPTVLGDINFNSKSMGEEIFGPILPVIEFDTIEEIISLLKTRPKSLALYIFTKNKKVAASIERSISYGSGCINDTVVQITNPGIPFGGVGNSGMGKYHGKYGFDCFSNKKGILKKALWLDLPLRYPPYSTKKLNFIKRFLKK